VVVPACDVAVSAAREPTVVPAWPVPAGPAVPAVLPPVVEVVPAGSGVVLELDDGVGVGVGEAGVMVADGEPEDVGVVDPLAEELGSGLYCPPVWCFLHPDGLVELPDAPGEPTGDPEPSGPWLPCPPLLLPPGPTVPEFSDGAEGNRAELLSPT